MNRINRSLNRFCFWRKNNDISRHSSDEMSICTFVEGWAFALPNGELGSEIYLYILSCLFYLSQPSKSKLKRWKTTFFRPCSFYIKYFWFSIDKSVTLRRNKTDAKWSWKSILCSHISVVYHFCFIFCCFLSFLFFSFLIKLKHSYHKISSYITYRGYFVAIVLAVSLQKCNVS